MFMDRSACLVTMKVNVSVRIISMERPVTNARRAFTISPLVKNVTAIQQELLLSLLDVDRYLLENCVNVKNESMEEYATNVDRCIGT